MYRCEDMAPLPVHEGSHLGKTHPSVLSNTRVRNSIQDLRTQGPYLMASSASSFGTQLWSLSTRSHPAMQPLHCRSPGRDTTVLLVRFSAFTESASRLTTVCLWEHIMPSTTCVNKCDVRYERDTGWSTARPGHTYTASSRMENFVPWVRLEIQP